MSIQRPKAHFLVTDNLPSRPHVMDRVNYVFYDMLPLQFGPFTGYEPDRYKEMSPSGGPLNLSRFRSALTFFLIDEQQPKRVYIAGKCLRAVLICGDNPPPRFSFGFISSAEISFEDPDWHAKFQFIEDIFLAHGWMIVELWSQDQSLYLDIALDVKAIKAVNGSVDDYVQPALSMGSLSSGAHNPNSFVLALSFKDVILPLPDRWVTSDYNPQGGSYCAASTGEVTSASGTNVQDFLVTSQSSSESQSEAHQQSLSLPESSTHSDQESVVDQEERRIARADAEYRLTHHVNPSNESFFLDVRRASSGYSDIIPANKNTHYKANRRTTIYYTGDEATMTDGVEKQVESSKSQESLQREPTNTGIQLVRSESTETLMPVAGPSSFPSDGSTPPPRKTKDLGEYLGIYQQPLKTPQPPSQDFPSSSERNSKGSIRAPKFLTEMFRTKEQSTAYQPALTDDDEPSTKRIIKPRPGQFWSLGESSRAGTLVGAAGGATLGLQGSQVGAFGSAAGQAVRDQIFPRDDGTGASQTLTSGLNISDIGQNGGNTSSGASGVDGEEVTPGKRSRRKRNRKKKAATTPNNASSSTPTDGQPSQIVIPAINITTIQPLPNNNAVSTATTVVTATGTYEYDAASWQAAARGRVLAALDQVDDEWESIKEIDDREIARKADEETAKAMKAKGRK